MDGRLMKNVYVIICKCAAKTYELFQWAVFLFEVHTIFILFIAKKKG